MIVDVIMKTILAILNCVCCGINLDMYINQVKKNNPKALSLIGAVMNFVAALLITL